MVFTDFLGIALIGFNSCTKEKNDPQFAENASILNVAETGASSIVAHNLEAIVPVSALSDSELEILLKLKEEEKLARDVYTALNMKWNIQIFSNISAAENTHMNAVIYLLQDFGTDYTSILTPGAFTNLTFQSLYDELVSKGSVSIEEGLNVGALIEEMDITDLTESLKSVTNENVIMVFENLKKGSRNHLRAFTSNLTLLGLNYTPVYLSQDEYNQIISSPNEAGKQYRMNNNGEGSHGNGTCNQ